MVGLDAQESARLRLEPSSLVASEARRFVERELGSREAPSRLLEATKLVASELVTNAYKHGQGTIELRLAFPLDSIRIEVIDQGSAHVPSIREQPADETGGWGLQIVEQVSRQWGVFEGTTHVWAELSRECPAGACPA